MLTVRSLADHEQDHRRGAAVLLGIGLAGTAHAASEPAPAPSELTLSVSGSERTWSRSAVLTCPAAGDPGHPDPVAACADLYAAGGDFDALPGDPHVCTKEYDPVTAEAVGTYQSRPVSWRKTYPNACEMDAATGPLFRF
ncbi:SSI family serine proteinase inhibitor [Streptomyces sp. NPDC055749]